VTRLSVARILATGDAGAEKVKQLLKRRAPALANQLGRIRRAARGGGSGLAPDAMVPVSEAPESAGIPTDITTALTVGEATTLRELADGKAVLELGAHYGFSTIVLARVTKELHSVDWHKGDPHAGLGDSLLTYRENLRRYGVEDKVVTHVGRFGDVLPAFREHYFDGCFVDGEHDFDSVVADGRLAWALVRPGGWVAFHDYGRFGVKRAVDAIARPDRVVDSLAVLTRT
jgi:predicted O-methyltransferase YrrM